MTFLGAIGLGWGVPRVLRGRRAAGAVWLATMPLFVFQVIATFVIPDERPLFAVGAGVAPLLAGTVWLTRRLRRAPAASSPGVDEGP